MEGVEEILSEIGWDSTFRIPLANDECKMLEDMLLKKQETVISLRADIASQKTKSEFIGTHLQNVIDEYNANERLMEARRKEIESEHHLRSIAERESGRLGQDIKSMVNLMHEIKQRRIVIEHDIVRLQESVDALKREMEFDREALEAWLHQMSERDDDILALEHYARMDEGMIKDLNLHLERLNAEERKCSEKLIHATTELMSVRVELDKLGEDYRSAHRERQDLLDQWEQTLQQIQRREKDIQKSTDELNKMKDVMAKRNEALEEQRKFLNAEETNNAELEIEAASLERESSKIRELYQRTEQEREAFGRELEALKTNVSRVSIMLEKARSRVHELKNRFAEKNRAFVKLRMEKDDVDKALEEAQNMAMSSEERARRLGEILQDEQQKQSSMEKELMRLKDVQFRKSNDLIQFEAEETAKNAEIKGCVATKRSVHAKIRKMDRELMKQQELIYSQELLAQNLQKRIDRMTGTRRDTERLRLEARIKELKQDLEKRNQTKSFLEEQVKRTLEAQRHVQRDLELNKDLTEQFNSKESELILHNECSMKELKRVVDRKQQAMVDENMLKLTIKHLRKLLHEQATEVFSLDQRRLEMTTAMRERRQEILAQQDLLKAEMRALDDEIHKLGRDLTNRASKLDKMKKRYEVLLCSMGPVEEDGEASNSHILFVIKAAQEKVEVQREGDELDIKIKRTEAELVALENTCEVLKLNNENYRRNLANPLETDEERENAAYLTQLTKQTKEQIHERRTQLLNVQVQLEQLQTELNQLTQQEEMLNQQQDDLSRRLAAKQKELKEQEAKLDRATRFNNHVIKQLRKKTGHIQSTREEKDIEVRIRKEETKLAVKNLCELGALDAEAQELITASLEEAGISAPASRASSQMSSERSLSVDDMSCSMESYCSTASVGTPASQRSELQFPREPSVEDETGEESGESSSSGSSYGSSESIVGSTMEVASPAAEPTWPPSKHASLASATVKTVSKTSAASTSSATGQTDSKADVVDRIDSKISAVGRTHSKTDTFDKTDSKTTAVSKTDNQTDADGRADSKISAVGSMISKTGTVHKMGSETGATGKTGSKTSVTATQLDSWISTVDKAGSKTSAAGKTESKISASGKMESKISHVDETDSRTGATGRTDSKTDAADRKYSSSGAIGKTDSKTSATGKADSRTDAAGKTGSKPSISKTTSESSAVRKTDSKSADDVKLERRATVGSVQQTMSVSGKSASIGSVVGRSSGLGSKPVSRQGSQASLVDQSVSQPSTSRQGSRTGSQQGSRPASQQGSRPSSQGSRPASQQSSTVSVVNIGLDMPEQPAAAVAARKSSSASSTKLTKKKSSTTGK